MTASHAYDTATTVTPVDGEVALDGPDGVGLSMTPRAAAQTGARLQKAAAEARTQPTRDTAEEDDED